MPRCTKKVAVLLFLVMGFLLACESGPGMEYRKNVDGMTISMSSMGKKVVKGSNDFVISLTDSKNQVIEDAVIMVRFFSEGMPPVDNNYTATLKKGGYFIEADLSAANKWNVEIHVRRYETNEPPADVSFTVNAH